MRTILRLIRFLNKYWYWVILAYICLFASIGFSLGIPYLVKRAIDEGISLDLNTGQISGDQQFLLIAGLAIVGASILRGVFAFGQTYLQEFIGQKIAYDIRNLLYDRIQRLSYAFHDRAQTGQLMSRATQDVEAVRMFVSMGALRMVQILVLLIGICVLLFSMNWTLAFITLSCIPPLTYWAYRFGKRLRPIWTNIQEGIARLGIHLQENLSGVQVVRAFSREGYEMTKFKEKAKQLYEDSLLSGKVHAFNMPLMAFIFTLASGIVIWYGGREVVGGRLTPGELTQFYFYLAMLMMPVRMLGFIVTMFSRGIAAGDRIFEILDARSAVQEKPGAAELVKVKGLVKFEDVSFSYDMNPYESMGTVLDRINLEAKPGEMVALLGSTGSGKSTLVNLIPRFYDTTSGRITIDDKDIRDVTLTSLRHNIGIVQQDVFLFSATIQDNIKYGSVDAGDEEVFAATKAAYLHDFIETLPEGYDTWVGERGITLSGGQKQRLAIARTLLVNPRILIFVVFTSSVDTQTEFLIQQALRELMKGRTTFVIAQRLQTVRDADQILVLDKGTIVERGTHTELLKTGAIYREIYELQLRDQEEAISKEAGQL